MRFSLDTRAKGKPLNAGQVYPAKDDVCIRLVVPLKVATLLLCLIHCAATGNLLYELAFDLQNFLSVAAVLDAISEQRDSPCYVSVTMFLQTFEQK